MTEEEKIKHDEEWRKKEKWSKNCRRVREIERGFVRDLSPLFKAKIDNDTWV